MARQVPAQKTRTSSQRRRTTLAVALLALVLVTGSAALANGGARLSLAGYGYGYGIPPEVNTEAASLVTPTSATLNATVNPEGQTVTECYFEYWGTEIPTPAVPCQPSPGAGDSAVPVAAAIQGLRPETTYHFTIVASNSSGTSYGDEQTFTTPSSAPSVTSINPDAGLECGWTAVTITGTKFTEATAVKFGANNAVYFEVNSPTSITALSPVGTGTVQVTVSNAGGASPTTPADQFTYVPPGHGPAITKLSPKYGPAEGSTAVSVTGSSFVGVTSVEFGSAKATSFTVTSSTSLTAVSPAEAPGKVELTVTTPNGTSSISPRDRFRFTKKPGR